MRCFAISLDVLLVRYFLMMACVIVGLFSGLNFLAFLALPIFLSAILGVSFRRPAAERAAQVATVVKLKPEELKEQLTEAA